MNEGMNVFLDALEFQEKIWIQEWMYFVDAFRVSRKIWKNECFVWIHL